MATPLVQKSLNRRKKDSTMFPGFLDNEVTLDELFPEDHEEELRINGGYQSKCGSWFVHNDGGVEIDAYQHRYLGYLMPIEVIEMILSDPDGEMLEQYPPEELLEWHQEDHRNASDPDCVFCQDRHQMEHVGKHHLWCHCCEDEHNRLHDKLAAACPFCLANVQSDSECSKCNQLGHYCPDCRDEDENDWPYFTLFKWLTITRGVDDDIELHFMDAEEEHLAQLSDATSGHKSEALRKPRSAFLSRRRIQAV